MPFDNTPLSLKTELSKLARMSNIQAGLPITLRILPVAAVLAGGAIAKVSGGSNHVEERMLGFDETILLSVPDQNASVGFTENKGEYTQRGGYDDVCEVSEDKGAGAGNWTGVW